MANEQNLRVPTSSEARENGKKGGLASGEARRNKKSLRECLEMLLEKEITDKSGNTMTGAEAMAVNVFKQALKGDLKAFEIVRDTAGQKPIEKMVISEIDSEVIEEIENIINEKSDS